MSIIKPLSTFRSVRTVGFKLIGIVVSLRQLDSDSFSFITQNACVLLTWEHWSTRNTFKRQAVCVSAIWIWRVKARFQPNRIRTRQWKHHNSNGGCLLLWSLLSSVSLLRSPLSLLSKPHRDSQCILAFVHLKQINSGDVTQSLD